MEGRVRGAGRTYRAVVSSAMLAAGDHCRGAPIRAVALNVRVRVGVVEDTVHPVNWGPLAGRGPS